MKEDKISIPKFEDIFSFESLFRSWQEFARGKKKKVDVSEFSFNLISNLWQLYNDIISGSYRHGGYAHFKINDPKPRDIHKASVRDRIVHHAIYRALYPYFDSCLGVRLLNKPRFIYDSYACRINKGTHRALRRFASFAADASCGNSKTVWILKCDIKKFFASFDHGILISILSPYIKCLETMAVIRSIVNSFSSGQNSKGLPLGNLTSQLFANVYMDKFDWWMKDILKVKYYIRYADDFVIISRDKPWLEELIMRIDCFLSEKLALDLHPDKISIRTLASGVDFLGWVHFPDHRVLRAKTKRRMFKRFNSTMSKASLSSYVGLLKHGNAHNISKQVVGYTKKMY